MRSLPLLIAAVIILPPLIIGWSLCRAAANGDRLDDDWDDDTVCPGCDGYLDYDDDGANICCSCGATWERA